MPAPPEDTAPPHLRLAGVTRLSLGGRGPRDAYLFEPHRLALPCWALALEGRPPALLVTLDRHLDLVPPPDVTQVPDRSAGWRGLDTYARHGLGVRNDDHILAAMEAGLVGDALVVARTHLPGAQGTGRYVDRRGGEHRIVVTPTVDRVADGFGTASASPDAADAATLLSRASEVLLDVDLDCFTTPSDADPTAIVPWPLPLIREHLSPRGSEAFWEAVLGRCRALTFARESLHCGGVVAGDALFAQAAQALFVELLGTDLP